LVLPRIGHENKQDFSPPVSTPVHRVAQVKQAIFKQDSPTSKSDDPEELKRKYKEAL